MPRRPARHDLPLDVRRRGTSSGSPTVLVEAVLDALPSPTLLLDAQGTVLLANSAWTAAADVLEDERVRLGVGGDYYAMVLTVDDDEVARGIIASLQALS